MQLFDLPWISHEGGNIFSLDLHPNGKKLATAGQDGGGAGLLVIWDIDFVNSLSSDSTSPSNCNFNPMARIPHTSTINCVRWSKQSDSKKLVCAGDDPVLCVYECVGVYSSLGSIGQMDSSKSNVANRNVESYRCIYKLYGHSLDVLHLDWSHDGKYLASCSLDNTIIIWNAQKLPEKVTILRESNGGHNRGVKGLAWDPIGRFLSTQAEDNSLKIWQTDSWTCVRTFTEPFCESAISTLFCRMDWSPDGSHLVAPCALNNGGPTAKIFVRKDWSHTRDLVGFRKAVSCVRSNPHCFQRTNSSGTHSTVSCFAVGCRDRSLSVWLIPNFARPIVVMEKLFKDTIVDLSWSKLTLAACSRDGVVRILNFTDNEIGHLLSAHETASILERLYGLHPNYCSTSLRDIHSRGGEAMAASPDFGYSSISDVLLTKRAKETIVTEEQLSRTLLNREPPRKRISTEQLQRFSLKCKRHKLGDKDNKSSNNSFLKSSLDAHNQLERDDLISISRPRVDNRLYEKKDAETEEEDTTKALFELPERRRLLIAVVEEKEKFTLELINDQLKSCSDSTIWARLIAYSGEGEGQKHPRWTFFYPRLVSILTANRKWTAITTFDAHLLVLSTQTGRHLFDICVDEPLAIVHLDGEADLCLSIGMSGNLSVWDIPNRRRLVHKSINSFFRHPNQQLITANALKLPGSTEEQATAQLQLSDLDSFVYSYKLDAWKKNSSFMDFLNAANLPINITSLLIQLQHDEQKEL